MRHEGNTTAQVGTNLVSESNIWVRSYNSLLSCVPYKACELVLSSYYKLCPVHLFPKVVHDSNIFLGTVNMGFLFTEV